MKKINLFLTILAAAAGFTNCTKAELVDNKEAGNGGTVVYATTDAATKTTLANDYNVLWSTGDQIKFVKDDTPATTYTFTLSEGGGTTSGTFTGDTPADGEYTVYYPATYDGSNWPAQTYVNATDISGALMKATATVSGGSIPDLTFTNEGGILRYTVKGSKTIKSINVKSGSTLDVTLDCGTSGVALTAEGTVFNIALPAGEYSDATLTFTATDKSKATKAASSFAVTKNVVSLATFEESALSFIAPPAPDGFVDLGITDAAGKPLYWAKCNLGATKAEDTGDYFAWGETAPYYTTTGGWPASPLWKSGKEGGYNVTSYCGGSSFVEWSTLPYDATSKILLPAYDAATAANPSWRTPTADEFSALVTNCVWIWTDDYNGTGKAGYIVYKAKTNADKGKANMGGTWKKWDASQSKYVTEGASDATGYTTSDTHIFFLIAGRGGNTSLRNTTNGYYCSSTLYKNTEYSFVLYFNSTFIYPRYESEPRHRGFSVRPVTTEAAAPTLPAGALKGEFSVSATKKVHFSQGNLVATIDASGAPTAWKFSAHQYDCLGAGGANTTIGSAAGDIDLFGWSTASTTYGIKTSKTDSDYSGDFKDWGTAIDGNGTWRTLSLDEWKYLFNKISGETITIRKDKYKYGVTICEKTKCLILVPDECLNGYSFDNTKTSYTVEEWATAEAAGLVCLPAAGRRNGTDCTYAGERGFYWSSTADGNTEARRLLFNDNLTTHVDPGQSINRFYGHSVRLITESK